jgi:cephalosporin hydroxylase
MTITINLDRAKTISHDIRRQKRSEEFDPLDQVIMRQIPGTDVVAIEAERQLIRDKYAEIQINIDSAQDSDQLLAVLQIT